MGTKTEKKESTYKTRGLLIGYGSGMLFPILKFPVLKSEAEISKDFLRYMFFENSERDMQEYSTETFNSTECGKIHSAHIVSTQNVKC